MKKIFAFSLVLLLPFGAMAEDAPAPKSEQGMKFEELQKKNGSLSQQKLISENNLRMAEAKLKQATQKLNKIQAERSMSADICGGIPSGEMEKVRNLAIGTTVVSGVGTLAGGASILSQTGVIGGGGKKAAAGDSGTGAGGENAVPAAASTAGGLQKATTLTHVTTIGSAVTSAASSVTTGVARFSVDFDGIARRMKECQNSFSLDY
ncbi:MAG: hypothetical protein LBO78_00825 [Rickettsiales bacterium]|nr:hypothetical protein [Rickettsiales bacterium]